MPRLVGLRRAGLGAAGDGVRRRCRRADRRVPALEAGSGRHRSSRPTPTGSSSTRPCASLTSHDRTWCRTWCRDLVPDPVQRRADPAPLSTLRSGAHLDRLAELEEERRFLLRSLDDLEREHEAGDVDDRDYETLQDGYTVRAAAVLRADRVGSFAPRPEAAASVGAYRRGRRARGCRCDRNRGGAGGSLR